AVASTYPKMRARSGSVEGIEKRVADCMERSLNGRAVPDSSREMRAIVAYIQWLGKGIPKGKKVYGTGFMQLAYLDRAADPVIGKAHGGRADAAAQLCEQRAGAGPGQRPAEAEDEAANPDAVVEFLVGQHDGLTVHRLEAVALDELNGNHAHQNGRADDAVHVEGL
nr:hypothetical protein [Tanacetum cinerariifolium]